MLCEYSCLFTVEARHRAYDVHVSVRDIGMTVCGQFDVDCLYSLPSEQLPLISLLFWFPFRSTLNLYKLVPIRQLPFRVRSYGNTRQPRMPRNHPNASGAKPKREYF